MVGVEILSFWLMVQFVFMAAGAELRGENRKISEAIMQSTCRMKNVFIKPRLIRSRVVRKFDDFSPAIQTQEKKSTINV